MTYLLTGITLLIILVEKVSENESVPQVIKQKLVADKIETLIIVSVHRLHDIDVSH